MNKNNINTQETNIAVNKRIGSTVMLVFATLLILVLSGILGAFQGGGFQKTADIKKLDGVILIDKYSSFNPKNHYEFFKDTKWTEKSKIKYKRKEAEEPGKDIIYNINYGTKWFWEDPMFYSETFLHTLMVMILYIALTNFLIVRKKEDNENYKKLIKDLNEITIETNSLPATTFEPYIEEWNNQRKIKQHISNIKYKLSRLENKTSYKVRKTFYVKTDQGLVFKEPEQESLLNWKERKYFYKKKELETFLEKEYIEKHVLFEKVKHFKKIHPSFVTTGKNDIVKSTDEYSNIKNNKEKQTQDYIFKALIGISMSFIVGIILSFTLITVSDHWLIILYSVLLKLLPLTLQIIFAIDYSNKYVEFQEIPNLKYRLNIASMYLVYMNKKGVE